MGIQGASQVDPSRASEKADKRKACLAKMDEHGHWLRQQKTLLREAFELDFKTITIAGAMGLSPSAVAFQRRKMGYGIHPPKPGNDQHSG